MRYVFKEQYGLQKAMAPWRDRREMEFTEASGSYRNRKMEIASPNGRELGWKGDRNTGSQIIGVLFCFLSKAIITTCATQETSSL